MPPRAKRNTSKPADEEPVLLDDEPEDETAPPAEPEICPTCFPVGWPEDAYSAGCEHGSWLHHERAALVR